MNARRKQILKVFAGLVAELVGLAARFGATYREFRPILQALYVEESARLAETERDSSNEPSLAAIGRLSGMTRRTIQQVNHRRRLAYRPVPHNFSTVLVYTWRTHPDYLSLDSSPLTIPVRGPVPSFASLIETVTGDSTLVDEELALLSDEGAVKVSGNMVRLCGRLPSFVGDRPMVESREANVGWKSIENVLSTCISLIDEPGSSSCLTCLSMATASSAEQFESLVRRLGQRQRTALTKTNGWVERLEEKLSTGEKRQQEVGYGMFSAFAIRTSDPFERLTILPNPMKRRANR